MTLAERLNALRTVDDSADLAELLGVEPSAIGIDWRGVTVAGETISFADARQALGLEELPSDSSGRTVRIDDLGPI